MLIYLPLLKFSLLLLAINRLFTPYLPFFRDPILSFLLE